MYSIVEGANIESRGQLYFGWGIQAEVFEFSSSTYKGSKIEVQYIT